MNILICGDSFAADWTVKYEGIGWPNMLATMYNVTNLAQAGCSEYKIYLQLTSVNLDKYDVIIVSHTSPNRIYINQHPVHSKDVLHKNSDLIYTDLKEHAKQNKSLQPIIDFYEQYFDIEYAKFIHNLLCKQIESVLSNFNGNVIHLCNLNWKEMYEFQDMLHFSHLFNSNRGLMNHYDQEGNRIIYNAMIERIKQS